MSAEREAVDEDEPVVRPERPPAPAPKSVSFFFCFTPISVSERGSRKNRQRGRVSEREDYKKKFGKNSSFQIFIKVTIMRAEIQIILMVQMLNQVSHS